MLLHFKNSAAKSESGPGNTTHSPDPESPSSPLERVLIDVRKNERTIVESLGIASGPISIKFKRSQYAGLRIFNSWREFLHPAGIELFLDNQPVDYNTLSPYTCKAGKEFKNEGKLPQFKLGEISPTYAFHTTRESENCWFEVHFESPVEFDEIRFHPRKDHLYRTISINVELILPDGSRKNVYSGLSRLDDLVAKRADESCKNSGVSRDQYEYLYRLLWVVIDDPYKYANPVWLQLLDDAENHNFDENEIKKFLSDNVLEERELAFTAYGLQRCFKFWTEDELRSFLQTTREAIDQLYDFCDSIFYAYGTLLGFVREPTDFIGHDNDIDIVCVFPMSRYHSLEEINKEMRPFLESRKFNITNRSNYSFHVKYKKSPRFDIFPALADARGNITIYPAFKGKYLNTSYLLPTIDIDVKGISCPIPKNPFKFLSTVYGDDWKIPQDKDFHKKQS